jgi:Zn-dependent M28 family amino/carboxypeptidase
MFRFLILFIGFLPGRWAASQFIVSDSLLKKHVQALAHDSMQGRLTGSAGAAKAASYIAAQMEAIGLKKFAPKSNSFLIPWPGKVNKVTGDHVVGVIPGSRFKDTLLIFTAHYDHIGYVSAQKALHFGFGAKRVKGDTIFNGANDNASGVAALLELARLYMQVQPDYTIIFAAFCGEEMGLWGSYEFAKELNPKLVKLNINLEMLGRPMGQKPFVTEPPDESEMVDKLNKNLTNEAPGAYPKKYFMRDPYPNQNLFKRSDNFSFHERGIPAYTIMGTNPNDIYYHSSADQVENIQFESMTKIVQAIVLAIKPMMYFLPM